MMIYVRNLSTISERASKDLGDEETLADGSEFKPINPEMSRIAAQYKLGPNPYAERAKERAAKVNNGNHNNFGPPKSPRPQRQRPQVG